MFKCINVYLNIEQKIKFISLLLSKFNYSSQVSLQECKQHNFLDSKSNKNTGDKEELI